jgi:hypothetical protein
MRSDVLIADENLTQRALVREIIRSIGTPRYLTPKKLRNIAQKKSLLCA